MKKLVKSIAGLAVLIAVLFSALTIFVSMIDADKYRPQIIDAISRQTGRTARLNGPIGFSLGLGGLKISVQDASIANPSWASRPIMAGMGRFEIGVALLPLLTHHIEVNRLSIENADILLETSPTGQHNWDFSNAPRPVQIVTPAAKAAPSSSASGLAVSVDTLAITNSQIALLGPDGKLSSYNVGELNLDMTGNGAVVDFKGDANGAPLALNVRTSITDLLSQTPFSFDAVASYQAFYLTATGTADLGSSRAQVKSYALSAGKSKIGGDLTASWGGARPVLQGSLNSDHLDLADFRMSDAAQPDQPAAKPAESSGGKRMFSDAPLPFDGLKAVDADLSVAVGEFPLGKGVLKQLAARLILSNGVLTLAPVKAGIGGSVIDFKLRLDASQSPAHVTVGLIGKDVDLGDLQRLGDMSPFMTGKAGANIQLAGQGASAHDIAASLGGVIAITAEKGEIFTGAAAGVSSALAAVFSPAGGNDALNCLAARFTVKNGVLNDNGILIDSAASVVDGHGKVNLGSENIDMVLHAKTKLIDIGGLVPALGISGSLSNPHYSVDAVGVVKNAVGSLLNGNVDIISSNVPDMQTAPAGQNACVYTLDHPQLAAQTGILPSGFAGRASQNIQKLGTSVLKGLFGN